MLSQLNTAKMAAASQENLSSNAESDLTELSWLTNSHVFGAKPLMSPTSPAAAPKLHHQAPGHLAAVLPLSNYNRANIEMERIMNSRQMQADGVVAAARGLGAKSAFSSYTKGGLFQRKKLLEMRKSHCNKKPTEGKSTHDESLAYSPASTNSTLSISPSLPSSPSSSSSSSMAASPLSSSFSPPVAVAVAAAATTKTPTSSAMTPHKGGRTMTMMTMGRKLSKPAHLRTTKNNSFAKKYDQQQQLQTPMLNEAYKNLLFASVVNPSLYASVRLFANENNSSRRLSEHSAEQQQPPSRPSLPADFKFKNSCGVNKPPLTLSSLIFMAIQESKDKCLPVREIYEWIEQNFPFYQNVSNGGWKSSIRHNLSFSKCFKKMDRAETGGAGGAGGGNSAGESSLDPSGRKRRAPNSAGTSWKVNPECRSFLIQTLKKSSFWFHNSKHYPNLNRYINSYCSSSSSDAAMTAEGGSQHHQHRPASVSNKKLKVYDDDDKISIDTAPDFEDEDVEDVEEDEPMMLNNRLLKFVQAQHRELCAKNLLFSPGQDTLPSTAAKNPNIYEFNAASLLARANFKGQEAPSKAESSSSSSPRHLDISLSSSSSSLTSAFALLSSSSSSSSSSSDNVISPSISSSISPASSKCEDVSVNSDLEMEVASTLVGMKWFANRQQQQQSRPS